MFDVSAPRDRRSLRGRRLCVRLSHGDAESVSGPAEPRQYPVRQLELAGLPPLTEATGSEHNAEFVQRPGHAEAVQLLRPSI